MRKKIILVFLAVLIITLISFFFSAVMVGDHRIKNIVDQEPLQAKIITKIVLFCNETDKDVPDTATIEPPPPPPPSKPETIDYLKKYPHFLNCKNPFNAWHKGMSITPSDSEFNFSLPADQSYHKTRFVRGVLVYFPITGIDTYRDELKWLYRSWVHMLNFEPSMWRTDLIVFVENDAGTFNASDFFMKQLNCRFDNLRKSPEDKPMCTLINYVALKKRVFSTPDKTWTSEDEKYQYLLKDVDIFKNNVDQLDPFYKLMKQTLTDYGYLDSILMAFEGYEYFKAAGYDFLVRSDMDVFLTPLFGHWLPRHCNDFNVGRGGYSTTFNAKRFGRIARNLGLNYAGQQNMGSTWYSTPDQFRLVSYLTLFGMAYLAAEEFSQVEREGKLGVQLWPDWHYGVLLLYGQTLALNHLIAAEQTHVVKLENYLDYPSGNTNSIHTVLNIHVFHGDDMFSKFAFRMGKYDEMNATDSEEIKFFCLKMALDGKRMSGIDLSNMLSQQVSKKT